MKTSLPFLHLLIIILIGGLSACETDDNPRPSRDPLDLLPPATQEGAEIWGAIINGEAVYSRDAYYSRLDLRSGKEITIYLGTQENEWGTVAINIEDTVSIHTGTFHLTNEYAISADYLGVNNTGCTYDWLNIIDGYCTITKWDPGYRKIIAGTFEFTSVKDGCDTLRVRNGRFDIVTSY